MIGLRARIGLGALGLVLAAGAAGAQTLPGRVELAMGITWSAPVSFDTPNALEMDRAGSPYQLFAADASVRASVGFGLRAAFRVNPRWEIETGAAYARPELSVHASGDIEGAESASIGETLQRIQLDAGVVIRVGSLSSSRKNQPFVTAGGGYLRELHEGQTLASNGQLVFAGGGIRRVLKSRPDARVTAVGLRLEALVQVRGGGVDLDDRTHVLPVAAGALFLRF